MKLFFILIAFSLFPNLVFSSCKTPDWSKWKFPKNLEADRKKMFQDYLHSSNILLKGKVVRAEKSIDGKVVYCTNLPWLDAMKLLKSSSVLAVPSRMESLPTNIKEAFFLKIPVVATNVGGIPELITHNKTGLLIPPEDSSKLSDEINKILNVSKFQDFQHLK